MKRNKSHVLTGHAPIKEHKKRIAYHEAGHAIAIIVNSEVKRLPPVFFRINFYDSAHSSASDRYVDLNYNAEIEDGRLIKYVPDSFDCLIENIESAHKDGSFFTAFAADMVNLLIGPLAEAKYTAMSDGEVFNKNLITLNALHNYGGSSDLTLINQYLECFSRGKKEQDNLLADLLIQAFDFVDNAANWEKIRRLARHIINENIKTIDCNKITTLLNQPKVNSLSLNKVPNR